MRVRVQILPVVAIGIALVHVGLGHHVIVHSAAGADEGTPAKRATEATVRVSPSSQTSAEGPWAPLVENLLGAASRHAGLCLVFGPGSGDLAAAIVRRSEFFVQALEADETQLEPTRRTLDATGLYGRRAAAERGRLSRLPFPDYCANLIVCDLPTLPQEAACWSELMRVLSPGGLAYVGQSAATA